MATIDEQPPTTSNAEDAVPPEEDDEDEPDEYFVEAIKGKRKNPKTGIVEYLIKWQDYPESANTWEPIDNLSCPDLITKFNEAEKNKKTKRRSTLGNKEIQTKRSKKDDSPPPENILVEDEIDNVSTTETLSSTDSTSKQKEVEAAARQPKGFERGLPIEQIVGSCTDDDDKIWFFIKWKGVNDFEMIESIEVEDKAPRALCVWYRERLYHLIKHPSDLNCQQVTQGNGRV